MTEPGHDPAPTPTTARTLPKRSRTLSTRPKRSNPTVRGGSPAERSVHRTLDPRHGSSLPQESCDTEGVTPAIVILEQRQIPHEVATYDHDPAASSYGDEAVEALGLDAATVFKTLLVRLDGGGLAVAVVPVANKLDLKAVAKSFGVKKAKMADLDEAERVTGYIAGGISPLGQKKRLPTVIDSSATALEHMHVSGGRRGVEISLAPSDLATLTNAVAAPIAK